jgi:hypothetical protein
MNIEFKEGAVCYADCYQWYAHSGEQLKTDDANLDVMDKLLSCPTFQLNAPREGWYIPKSELDTEEKYNKAIEEFGLFGFKFMGSPSFDERITSYNVEDKIAVFNGGLAYSQDEEVVKVGLSQLMAIGELKRKMNEREEKFEADFSKAMQAERSDENIKRNKSKQAYKILNDMGIEYDQAKQQWFKKEYL